MRTRLLVTGHTGFIGSVLCSALRKDGRFELVGVSRSNGKNLLDSEVLIGLPLIDKIIHLAGSVGVLQSWDKPLDSFQNNIIPTLHVLEFARTHAIPVIHMSSYLYGEPKHLPIDEAHPIDCRNPYAESKRQAEMLCEAYARYFGLSVTILRPFNVYGPGQTQDNLIPYIIMQAKEKSSIQVKDLRPKRDYLYVDDLVNALLEVIHSEQNGLETYNLGFGRSYSVREVIDIVLNLIDKQISIHSTGQHRQNEIMDCVCDSRKFSEQFGWKPQVTLEEGIKKSLKPLEAKAKGESHDERS